MIIGDGPISENIIAKVGLTDFSERRFRIFGSTFIEVDVWDGLKLKTSLGGDYNYYFWGNFSLLLA